MPGCCRFHYICSETLGEARDHRPVELSDIARSRVAAHHLDPADQSSVLAVVESQVAMQAQDYRGGLWSVGVRTPDLTEADVERALLNREIVRTWPMRGTLHLVAAADARWLPELLGPRASQSAAGRRRALGLDEAAVKTARAAWEAGLSKGCLGRPELFALMDAAGVDSGDQRGPHMLRYLAEQGVLCFGPHAGNQPTYALLQEWVPDARVLDRDEALAELALRYFTSHGPVTLEDFAGWGFMTKGDARAGLAAVEDRLESIEVDGVQYWHAGLSSTPTGVQLLPGFDEYVLGYKNRSAFLTPEIMNAVVPGGNGVFKASVLYDGQIVGLWTVKKFARRQQVQVTWFEGRPVPPIGLLEAAVQRYGRYCDIAIELAAF